MPDIERLLNAIDAAEETAYGSDGDSDLQQDRALSVDYYNGSNVEPAPEGRSQVVDRSVFETVQWILPSLCRIFANGSNVVEFTPIGEEDEKAAQQESDYLNYIVTQKNPWFLTFLTWAQDALITKNAYCLPYMEEVLRTEEERYEGQSDESLTLLLQGDGVEPVEPPESYPDPSGAQVPVIDPLTGQPAVQLVMGPQGPMPQPVMQPKMLHNVTIRRTKPQKKLCFEVLPPERCKISESTPSFSLEKCDYFEYFDYVTISHLRAMGFEVDDDIESDEDPDSEEDDARDLFSESVNEDANPIDPAMRRVKFRTIWIRYDYDEDGISELQKVYRVGQSILKYAKERQGYGKDRLGRETCSRIPVACIVPTINTHRHIGGSIADQVADLQRIKTFILRQGLDNLYLANNPRTAVTKQVNLDDMVISQPGGVVQIDTELPDAGGHVVPLVTQPVFPQAMEALEYMDRISEGRSGVSRAFSGVDPNALNKGSAPGVAINQLSTMAAQRVEQIARIIAFGVEYLFSVAHELVLKHGHQAETVKLRGQWTTVDPSTWKTGRDMRIVVGYGAGNKDALVSRLTLMATAQKEALTAGLPIVTPANAYETMIELTKASDFTVPERFWTRPDQIPEKPPPQPTPDTVVVAEVEKAKIASTERVRAAEIASDERQKVADLDQKERDSQRDAELAIVLEQMKQGGNVDLERVRGALKNEPVEKGSKKIEELAKAHEGTKAEVASLFANLTNEFRQSLQKILDNANAPREVVRGKDGKVSGVKIGGVERKVKRDADGRVSGLQ